MSVDAARYLEMERAFYADLVSRSDFANEAFTRVDTAEFVVGSYAQHEEFDYERWLLGGVPVDPTAVALEYGCGPGRMLLRLSRRFNRVDGVDISKEVIEVAARRVAALSPTPRLFLTDGKELPAALDATYDVAFSVICLQHICVYTVRRRILEGLHRALKPGGLLTFQMGFGPGHPRMVDYLADFVDAPGANGAADVGVLHPAEIAGDLRSLGFTAMGYALTPSGPGDTHGGWIFVRALKSAVAGGTTPMLDVWRPFGFMPLVPDEAAAARTRDLHQQRGVAARLRDAELQVAAVSARVQSVEADACCRAEEASRTIDTLQGTVRELQATIRALERQAETAARAAEDQKSQAAIAVASQIAAVKRDVEDREAHARRTLAALERERDRLIDSLRVARGEIEVSGRRVASAKADIDRLERRVDVDERQLRRLRVADEQRVRALVAELVQESTSSDRPLGVLGAGEHTAWLLRETSLGGVADLLVFDSDPARAGGRVCDRAVIPATEISVRRPGTIVVSSLAFQEEMVTFLKSLSLPDMRIVCCYP